MSQFTMAELIEKNKTLINKSIAPALTTGLQQEAPLLGRLAATFLDHNEPDTVKKLIAAANTYLPLDGVKAALDDAFENTQNGSMPSITIQQNNETPSIDQDDDYTISPGMSR